MIFAIMMLVFLLVALISGWAEKHLSVDTRDNIKVILIILLMLSFAAGAVVDCRNDDKGMIRHMGDEPPRR